MWDKNESIEQSHKEHKGLRRCNHVLRQSLSHHSHYPVCLGVSHTYDQTTYSLLCTLLKCCCQKCRHQSAGALKPSKVGFSAYSFDLRRLLHINNTDWLCDMSPMINTWKVATSWTHGLPLECTYWWDYIGIYGICKCTIISSNSITLYVCRLSNELWITSALEDLTNMEEREWLSFVHSSALAVFGGSKPIAFLNTLHSSVLFPLYARACACHGQVKCAVRSSQCLFWLVCFTCIVCTSWLRWNYIVARSKVHI